MAIFKSETYGISLKKHQSPHFRIKARESGNYLQRALCLFEHINFIHNSILKLVNRVYLTKCEPSKLG